MARVPSRGAAAPRGKASLRGDFAPGEFEVAIQNYGYDMLWEQAAVCPCRNNLDTNQPLATCPVCYGFGWEYHSPLEVRGIVDALDLNRDTMIAFGTWTFGTAKITVQAEHRPAHQHRYTLLGAVMEVSERRERRAARETLRYPVASTTMRLLSKNAAGEDVVRPAVEINVLRLRLMDTATREPGAVLHPGEDFDVKDGKIDWGRGDQRGTAPAQGGVYAVTYYARPRYVVQTMDHAIRDTWVKLKQPTLTREHLPVTVLAKLDYDTHGGRGAV